MGYKIFNAEGRLVGGDDVLDQTVKNVAAEEEGWVTDDEGAVVYTSPARAAMLAEAEEGE